jgi:CheY-like chemotaxis protein
MSRKILLADDSVTIQKVIELTFMDEDYEVRAVSNGDEALAALPTVNPDFVIADVHMPGANGYEVCRRSKEIHPDVPVLLLVGTFEPFDEGQARAAGADSFLKKPFDSQELLQRVQDLLASRHASAPAPAATPPPLPLPHLGTTPMFAAPEPPTLAFNATPFRQQAAAAAEPDWGSFQLDPEPQHAHSAFAAPEPYAAEPFPLELSPLDPSPLDLSPLDQTQPSAPLEVNPFLDEHSPFVLEDDRSAAAYPVEESPRLPDDVTMFDRESPPPFRLEPHPAAPAAPELSALSDISDMGFDEAPRSAAHPPAGFGTPWTGDDTNPEVHLGVPESAVPLVHDLAETEARIEAPPPASILDSHEPEAAASVKAAAPEPWSAAAERPPLPPTAPLAPPPYTPPPFTPPAAPLQVGSVSTGASTNGGGRLSDEDVDRIARRVVELIGDKTVRDVAWEVVPDMAEAVIRDRLRELESQVENSAE